MFYHLTIIKILIIKNFHIRRTVKYWHGNARFAFFFRLREYVSTRGVDGKIGRKLLPYRER